VPVKAIVKMLITRPRFSSGTIVCRRVLLEAISKTPPAPPSTRKQEDNGNQRESANPISAVPRKAPPKVMTWPNPRTDLRVPKYKAPRTAPVPADDINPPSVRASPWKTSRA
jgi:hypothetical protein